MYALIENGAVKKYPYSPQALRADNPNTSFPEPMDDSVLAEHNVYPVQRVDPPAYDDTTNISEGGPELVSGQWVQTWVVTLVTEEELTRRRADRLLSLRQQRQAAYAAEADPLFFKWQAGEGSESDWLAKRDEIRNRFPYPETGE